MLITLLFRIFAAFSDGNRPPVCPIYGQISPFQAGERKAPMGLIGRKPALEPIIRGPPESILSGDTTRDLPQKFILSHDTTRDLPQKFILSHDTKRDLPPESIISGDTTRGLPPELIISGNGASAFPPERPHAAGR
jgi:hypothetical protein